jgi:S-disulfanyl-L-cysteine oxidoreductase SoxD
MNKGIIAAMVVVGATALATTSTKVGAHASPFLGRTVWDSVYSAPQAARGESAYVKTCAKCHQASLGGADESPALVGSAFLGNWNGQSVAALHDRIRSSMPPDDPGTYSRELVTDVIAYMLKMNAFPAGASELPKESEGLKDITILGTKP